MAKDKQYGTATLAREAPAKKSTASTTAAPIRSTVTEPAPQRRPDREPVAAVALPFGRQNYTLMLIGIGVILAGFFIMSLDREEFGFGFLGLTLGPIVVMSGFILEFFAILAKPKA
jgi:hypothetical protein